MVINKEWKTILSFASALILLFLILKHSFLIILALVLLLAGITSGTLRRIISEGLLRFSHFMGRVNTKILLLLVFFVILTPLAMIRRMVSKPSRNQDKITNWHTRNHVFQSVDLEKMW